MKSFKPKFVNKQIQPLNDTINFKLIFKTTDQKPYITLMKDFLFWNGVQNEEFCEPENYQLCSDSQCSSAKTKSSKIVLKNNPSSYIRNEGVHLPN